MSDGLNDCKFIGNLAADPELRSTTSGEAILKFRIGCTESYLDRNKTRQEKTEWVSCVLFGKRGEALANIMHKGDRVFVSGNMSTSSYEDKDKVKRYKTDIRVGNVILCGVGGKRSGGQDSAPVANNGQYPDEVYGEKKTADESDPYPF